MHPSKDIYLYKDTHKTFLKQCIAFNVSLERSYIISLLCTLLRSVWKTSKYWTIKFKAKCTENFQNEENALE